MSKIIFNWADEVWRNIRQADSECSDQEATQDLLTGGTGMTTTEITDKYMKSLINSEADNRTALLDTIRSLSRCIQSDARKLWDEIYATYPDLRGKENYVKRDGNRMFICTMADDEDSAIAPMQTIQVG